jgi:hypothetical protein
LLCGLSSQKSYFPMMKIWRSDHVQAISNFPKDCWPWNDLVLKSCGNWHILRLEMIILTEWSNASVSRDEESHKRIIFYYGWNLEMRLRLLLKFWNSDDKALDSLFMIQDMMILVELTNFRYLRWDYSYTLRWSKLFERI